MTYRPRADGGFAEDPLYRNLHPMLGKRLELWRLANFRLERLPSVEDIYLFHGVARDEPEGPSPVRARRGARPDRRAGRGRLADVPLAGTDGPAGAGGDATGAGRLPDPRAARSPTASCSTCGRRGTSLQASRPTLAESLAPLAEGAGLEKVVLRVRIPQPDGQLARLRPARRGHGRGGGVTVRERPPGDEPVRPLTRYRQKVLRGRALRRARTRTRSSGCSPPPRAPPRTSRPGGSSSTTSVRTATWCRSSGSPGTTPPTWSSVCSPATPTRCRRA